MQRALRERGDEEEIVSSIMKFLASLVLNQESRIDYCNDIANGVTLFRETARVLNVYGNLLLNNFKTFVSLFLFYYFFLLLSGPMPRLRLQRNLPALPRHGAAAECVPAGILTSRGEVRSLRCVSTLPRLEFQRHSGNVPQNRDSHAFQVPLGFPVSLFV